VSNIRPTCEPAFCEFYRILCLFSFSNYFPSDVRVTWLFSFYSQVDAETLTYFRFRNLRGIRRVFGCSTFPQRKLWAIIIAFQVYVFVQQGQERTFVLFLQSEPLRCNPTQIGLQLFVLYGLAALGAWPGVPLMQLVVTDLAIASIAMVSKMLGSLLLVAAKQQALVFVCKFTYLQ